MFINGDEKTGAKLLQKLAREEMKLKLLADIKTDLIICNIEGDDPKEYITELKKEIDNIYNKFIENKGVD